MPLPNCFCWTRFGTEAGQAAHQILLRKEQERAANNGVFFWGIGNAIGPSMLELLRHTGSPEVIFSPIRSAPRRIDVRPSSIAAWTRARTLDGTEFALPKFSLITSRFDPLNPQSRHYALVCYKDSQITLGAEKEKIQFGQLRNLVTGRPIGASQVTAVVHRSPAGFPKALYEISFRAQLAPPYFIYLKAPAPLATSDVCS